MDALISCYNFSYNKYGTEINKLFNNINDVITNVPNLFIKILRTTFEKKYQDELNRLCKALYKAKYIIY